jgi:hypothetical protein
VPSADEVKAAGPATSDDVADEVARLREEIAALRAELRPPVGAGRGVADPPATG